MTSKYDDRLKCRIQELDYNFATKTGLAYFPSDNCCDMGGIIEIFTNIDKNVALIETYADGASNTVYQKSFGKWHALNPPYVKLTKKPR